MSNYRDLLVNMVRATGEYITNNADALVDPLDLKTDYTMHIYYPQDGLPEISITQDHVMQEVTRMLLELKK